MIANIRPGILVALRTRVVGGCEYAKVDLEPGPAEGTAVEEMGIEVKRWETTRTIEDPVEWERAKAARTAAQAKIRRVCVRSDFGLLCPQDKEAELDAAVEAAHAVEAEHNASAKITRLDVYVLKGRVASTDEEALKGIASEVRGLLDQMQAGVVEGNVEAVREAASRAKKMGAMLDDTTAEQVREAVAEAREAAREIVKRVVDGEETLTEVLKDVQLDALKTARIAFLDVEEASPEEIPTDRKPAKAAERVVDVDNDQEVA